MPQLQFDPKKDIPNLDGKVILVTGGTAGLGYESVLSLAAHHPAQIFFTGRSRPSADKLLSAVREQKNETKVTFVPCDQSSLASVRETAQSITSQTSRLDVVIANAGVMALPPGQTEDGYETQFGINHVGHALLVELLLPLLDQTASKTSDARVIWLTSQGYAFHPRGGIRFEDVQTSQSNIVPWSSFFGAWFRYGQAKLANLLYARAFAAHHPTITSISIHPGISITGLVSNLPWTHRVFIWITTTGQRIPPSQCAWHMQWAATCPKERLESGKYYEPIGEEGKLSGESRNDELAEKLYQWTQRELEGWMST